jgi:hypothetical protein
LIDVEVDRICKERSNWRKVEAREKVSYGSDGGGKFRR